MATSLICDAVVEGDVLSDRGSPTRRRAGPRPARRADRGTVGRARRRTAGDRDRATSSGGGRGESRGPVPASSRRLWTKRPAQMSTTSDIVTWPMTSRFRRRWRDGPIAARPPSLSTSVSSNREALSAGQRPVATPAATDDQEREDVDPPVPGMIGVDGDVARGREAGQGLARPAREDQGEPARDRGQDQALHHLEPDEAEAARAERRAHHEVPLADEGAGEHEVRDVGAGDEEDEPHHGREDRREDGQEVGDARDRAARGSRE